MTKGEETHVRKEQKQQASRVHTSMKRNSAASAFVLKRHGPSQNTRCTSALAATLHQRLASQLSYSIVSRPLPRAAFWRRVTICDSPCASAGGSSDLDLFVVLARVGAVPVSFDSSVPLSDKAPVSELLQQFILWIGEGSTISLFGFSPRGLSFSQRGLSVLGSLPAQVNPWTIRQLRIRLSSTGCNLVESVHVKPTGETDDLRYVLAAGNALQVAAKARVLATND